MRFSVGSVFGAGLGMWLRSLWRHAPVIAVGYAPVLGLVGYVLAHPTPGARSAALGLVGELAIAALLLLDLPITAIVTHAVAGELRGQPPSRRASLRAGLRRTPQVALVTALIYLVMMATGFVAVLPIAGADTIGGAVTVAFLMLALWTVGAVALISRWAVAVPAAVLERPGVVGALRRSDRLTAGRRIRLAVLVVLVGAIHVGVVTFAGVLGDVWEPVPSAGSEVGGWAAALLLAIPLSVLRAAFAATAYTLIAEDVEGDSPERLGDVFG